MYKLVMRNSGLFAPRPPPLPLDLDDEAGRWLAMSGAPAGFNSAVSTQPCRQVMFSTGWRWNAFVNKVLAVSMIRRVVRFGLSLAEAKVAVRIRGNRTRTTLIQMQDMFSTPAAAGDILLNVLSFVGFGSCQMCWNGGRDFPFWEQAGARAM